MRGLLGPPPALPRLQSKAPSGAPAPTAELGTLCLRLHVCARGLPLLYCRRWVGMGPMPPRRRWHWCLSSALPVTCQCPANLPPEGDFGKLFYLEAGGQGFCP